MFGLRWAGYTYKGKLQGLCQTQKRKREAQAKTRCKPCYRGDLLPLTAAFSPFCAPLLLRLNAALDRWKSYHG
jgi:hypothetical protein